MSTHSKSAGPSKVIDPVCGMTIDADDAAGDLEYKGQTYYFCSAHCEERFRSAPATFVDPVTPPVAEAAAGTIYVCPMHPEVRQSGPGACPKCGMALEPDLSTVPQTRVEYTCPMHPEIVRDAPGACPICGMALEPRTVGLEDGPNPELIDMSRRFRIAAILAAPVFLLAMGDMVLGMGLGGRLDLRWANWI